MQVFLISNFRRILNIVFFFWIIPRHLNFITDVSEHSVCSIFIGGEIRKNKCEEVARVLI